MGVVSRNEFIDRFTGNLRRLLERELPQDRELFLSEAQEQAWRIIIDQGKHIAERWVG